MDWVKRNLYFLIGSLVALALMGLAGWYLYSKWQLNNESLAKLDEQYAELGRLNQQNPHPGSDKVDNIKAAQEQEKEVLAFIQKAREYFQPCPPIPVPESGKLTSQEFSSALSRTIDQLQREATKSSVTLPPKDASGQTYSFSFTAQRPRLDFAAGSLEPLSGQLAEVKAICTVLFQAKVNSLDNIRRERISDDDSKGPLTDYLPEKSVTNELAIMSPYDVTFRCFSPELAMVLGGFSASPCGLIVKTINVEVAPATAPTTEEQGVPAPAYTPAYAPPPQTEQRPANPEAAFMRRYGMSSRYMRGPAPVQPVPQPVYVPPPVTPVSRGGLPVAVDEKLLKVTLNLQAVKLLPRK